MMAAGTREKQEMVQLGSFATGKRPPDLQSQRGTFTPAELVSVHWPPKPNAIAKSASEPTLVNMRGRVQKMDGVHVTADRAQNDLLRNTCASDQKDAALRRRREHFAGHASVPSTESVADYFRMQVHPAREDESSAMLSEQARRGLARWQIGGPEANTADAAQVMRSLRGLSRVVKMQPTYRDHSRDKPPGGISASNCLHEYKQVKDLSRYPQPVTKFSRPAPMRTRTPPAPEDFQSISKPGGYICKLMDSTPFQMTKNKVRNQQSKIGMTGGATDYATSYGAMSKGIQAQLANTTGNDS